MPTRKKVAKKAVKKTPRKTPPRKPAKGKRPANAFPIGNQLWKLAKCPGQPRIFKTPDDLWNAAVKYFEWIDDNPIYEAKPMTDGGSIEMQYLPKLHAMTKEGLCVHMGISFQTFEDYRARPEYLEVTKLIESVIREQKFAGASAGQLKENIIARDLGLTDKKELSGANGGPVQVSNNWSVQPVRPAKVAKD